MDKKDREVLEYKSLYTDERYAKRAWREVIGNALQSPGKTLPITIDPKTNEMTFQSALDQEAYENVKHRLKSQGLDREPQQAELIVESNILRARFSDSTFNIILERTAGKVKDEVIIGTSQFEELTDEELEVLVKYRQEKGGTNDTDK